VAYSSAFKVSLRANCTSPAAPFIAPKEGVPSNPLTFVKAYPIPSNSRITLEIDGSTEGVTQIEVLDLTGKVVQRSTQNVFDGFNELTLDIDDLSKGLYLVKVKDSSNQAVVLKVSKM
jgi:Secretion system C-terminal sorting domain